MKFQFLLCFLFFFQTALGAETLFDLNKNSTIIAKEAMTVYESGAFQDGKIVRSANPFSPYCITTLEQSLGYGQELSLSPLHQDVSITELGATVVTSVGVYRSSGREIFTLLCTSPTGLPLTLEEFKSLLPKSFWQNLSSYQEARTGNGLYLVQVPLTMTLNSSLTFEPGDTDVLFQEGSPQNIPHVGTSACVVQRIGRQTALTLGAGHTARILQIKERSSRILNLGYEEVSSIFEFVIETPNLIRSVKCQQGVRDSYVEDVINLFGNFISFDFKVRTSR